MAGQYQTNCESPNPTPEREIEKANELSSSNVIETINTRGEKIKMIVGSYEREE